MKQKSISEMFSNNCVQYEKVKFNSFSWHFYFKHESQRFEQHQSRIEMYQLYDSDDHKTITDFSIICDNPNTKFKRLNYMKHYQLKLKPKWASIYPRPTPDPTKPLLIYRNSKLDNPWWDTEDLNTDAEWTGYYHMDCRP